MPVKGGSRLREMSLFERFDTRNQNRIFLLISIITADYPIYAKVRGFYSSLRFFLFFC